MATRTAVRLIERDMLMSCRLAATIVTLTGAIAAAADKPATDSARPPTGQRTGGWPWGRRCVKMLAGSTLAGAAMSDMRATAGTLRQRFKAIPKDQRDANQPFSIRVWRGLSWLERAEAAEDLEGRFISLWIAFNAIYGCLEDGVAAPDHGSWQKFLADIIAADGTDALGEILWAEQLTILRLIDSKYLFRPFWLGQADADERLRRSRQEAMRAYNSHQTLAVLQELFERLYVMRQQVFHGAATSGSKLNRTALKRCTAVMEQVMPAMIEIMIAAGPGIDWGEVCFPPVSE